jgi:hypothetical protein
MRKHDLQSWRIFGRADGSACAAVQLIQLFLGAFIIAWVAGCANVGESQANQRPFYQQPYDVTSHGRKDWWDRIVELDPSPVTVKVSRRYIADPPERIAVLPFIDDGSAQYVVDKIPLTHRDKDQQERWAWTDAQRLRLYMVGYLAQREFIVRSPIGVDAVLKAHGIKDGKDLARISPRQLGQWLDADALVYGEVTHYEGYYLFLVSAEQVSIRGRMVSTADGKTLISFRGGRYHVNPMPAIDPIDMVINSVQTMADMRDVNIARAEDEACREVVVRIPQSPILRHRIAQEAIQRANDLAETDMPAASSRVAASATESLKVSSAAMSDANRSAAGSGTPPQNDP